LCDGASAEPDPRPVLGSRPRMTAVEIFAAEVRARSDFGA